MNIFSGKRGVAPSMYIFSGKQETMTRYIFVTGGVVSGLGKGITAASLGRLLKARGYHVTMQKLDPYLNVDPGTMNPIQHGEVFVTDDGTETDLDLGHYERFIDENLNCNSNVTSGKIYWSVLNKERHGDYGGGTVQVIPHVTNEIKSRFYTGQPFGTLAPQEKLPAKYTGLCSTKSAGAITAEEQCRSFHM